MFNSQSLLIYCAG